MNRHLSRHPLFLSLLPLLFTWLLLALAQPRELHNDDFQLYFQLCNGGAGSIPFSGHAGYLTGLLLMGLNGISDSVNWYLILLLTAGSLACFGLNFFAIKWIAGTPSHSSPWDAVRMLSALALLCFINYKSLSLAQYTSIGVLSACTSLFLLYDWSQGVSGKLKYTCAVLLFIWAYEWRDQSVLPFFFLGVFVFLIVLLSSTPEAKQRFIRGATLFPIILAALHSLHAVALNAAPEWQDAVAFNHTRTRILDSKDNSGVDKSQALERLGINSQDFHIFKSFTYLPGFCNENASELEKVLKIHNDQRKGLFGLDFAAKHGLLELGDYRYKEGDSPAQAITPWIPVCAAFFLVVIGMNRRSMAHTLPMLAALLGYFSLLFVMQRVVGRVFHPVLYASAVWILAAPISANAFTRNKFICCSVLVIQIMAALFCLRDARHQFNQKEQPWKICAQNPQNLYLTTSMQHLCIYPPGWKGVSLHYFATTNMLPIADGWCFYSPAYHAALHARGIKNPYAEICKSNTFIITQNDRNASEILSYISAIHEKQMGTPLRFRITETTDKFSFWKAEAAD